jgi:DNA (cytosine-5)-methyltransferase 1
LRGYLETGNKKRKGVAADAGASVEAGCWWDGGQVSQTLDAVLAKGQTMPEKNRFPAVLTPYTASSFAQYAEGVGTVRASGGDLGGGSETLLTEPVPFRKSKRACSTTDNETWVPADASNTLNNFDLGDTRTTHAVVQGVDLYNQTLTGDVHVPLRTAGGHGAPACIEPVQPQGFSIREDSKNNTFHAKPVDVSLCVTSLQPSPQSQHAQNFIVQSCSDVSPTVSSGAPFSKTGNERVETEALAITFQPGNLRREAGADPSFTTTTTLKASAGDQTPHVAIPPMAVRRLTPVECERLQGFPDNWSRISWKGKPEEECPDGPRYKACGNSMAVPCMFWIGSRIAAVDSTLPPNA